MSQKPDHTRIDAILAEVKAELLRAIESHAPMNTPHEGWAVIQEEVDELWDDIKANKGYSSAALHEAIQAAAMNVRYVLDLAPFRTPHP